MNSSLLARAREFLAKEKGIAIIVLVQAALILLLNLSAGWRPCSALIPRPRTG